MATELTVDETDVVSKRHPLRVTRDRLLASVDEHLAYFSPAERRAVGDVIQALWDIEHEVRELWR